MPKVVGAKLSSSSIELWFNPLDLDLRAGDIVMLKTAQGLEIGKITRSPFEVERSCIIEKTGKDWLRMVDRLATDADKVRAKKLQKKAQEALFIFKKEAAKLNLDLKAIKVCHAFDDSKVTCYFSADERVDFRELVKNLSLKFSKKVEMKQIGPRQEAALCGGVAHCGCEYCCVRWESEFSPVSIRMAKDQNLSINNEGISGACGRLMCCLRFETEAYQDFKKCAPKKGAKIKTPSGIATVIGLNMPKEQVELKFEESGKRVSIKLCDLVASEEARKKAQENNCSLRPDTLSQEAYDALDMMKLDAFVSMHDKKEEEVEQPLEQKLKRVQKKTHGMQPRRRERKRDRRAEQSSSATPVEPQQLPRSKRIRKHKRFHE